MAQNAHSRAMHEYYERDEEAGRLTRSGKGRVEFERTAEIVLRALPAPPATVADIGGGPGRYTFWLADLGYRVAHRDLVPLHVQHVRDQAGNGQLVDSAVANALSLDLAESSVDAVLLLGPLYHLERESDRVQALREAARIVRPGGPVFGAAISRWSVRLDGMLRERIYEKYPHVDGLLDEIERTGLLPPLGPRSFCGFTHRPEQLAAEFTAAGLTVADLVGVEGGSFLLNDLDDRIADDRAWQVVLEQARAHERVPELLGLSPHLLATGLRP
jgi:SAM-dependent methyltransferase